MPALGESAAEYDRMRDGLYRALCPADTFEEMIVDAMAGIHWRLRRMIRVVPCARHLRAGLAAFRYNHGCLPEEGFQRAKLTSARVTLSSGIEGFSNGTTYGEVREVRT